MLNFLLHSHGVDLFFDCIFDDVPMDVGLLCLANPVNPMCDDREMDKEVTSDYNTSNQVLKITC